MEGGRREIEGGSGLTEISIPTSIISIEEDAFHGCKSLGEITIPNSVTSIGQEAFRSCYMLKNVHLGSGLQTIGAQAFDDCEFSEIVIPASVTSIGNSAFHSNIKLEKITSLAITAPTISYNTFEFIKSGGTLYVPQGATGYDKWMQTSKYYLGYYNWPVQEMTD